MARCVSVFRACHRSAAGSACSRRKPGRSRSDHFAVDGHVVPLPDRLQAIGGEVVAALVGRVSRLAGAGVGLHPGARRASQVAGQAEVGPAVRPGDGRERRQASHRVGVHHREAPPLARGRVDDAALVDGAAPRRLCVGRVDLERRLPRAPDAIAHAETEVLAATDVLVDLPGALQAIGAGHGHPHLVHEPGAGDEVLALDLVEVQALAHAGCGCDQLTVGAGHQVRQVSRRAARGGCPGSPRPPRPCRRRRTAPRDRGARPSSRVRVHGPAGFVARKSCVVWPLTLLKM